MKLKQIIKPFLIVLFLVPALVFSQENLGDKPDDDLGNVTDDYQESFFEALKQKGIENYDRAVSALQKCLEIDDSKPVIYFELGKNYKHLKNFSEAEKALKKAISMQPDNEWFLDELYDVYFRQDDIDNAIVTLKQLVKYHPDYKQDLATLYIKKEKFTEALQLINELDNQYGTDEVRTQMRDNIYSLTGDASDQIEKLKSRISANPNNENNYLQLIYRYSQTGKTKEAFSTAQDLLKAKPNSKYAHLALYKYYLEENSIGKAVSSMKLVLKASEIDETTKGKVLKDFVAFVEKNPQYKKDLIEATDGVDTNKSEEALANLGTYYSKSGDKEKALKNFKEALSKNPNDFKLMRDVILIHIDLKQYEEALKQSNTALELYPAQPILYLLSGVSQINLNQSKKAIDSLEMGLDFLVENPKMERDFYLQLSEAYAKQNNNTKSQTFAKKAQAIKL